MNRLIEDDQKQRLLIASWFNDADTWVGVFENHDLGHPDRGLRCAFPFAISDGSMEKSIVGQTRAPDGRIIGMGWRYLLVAKCSTAEEALAHLRNEVKAAA
jgi:hypothetical protein